MKKKEGVLPRARRNGLIVRSLSDETLVYDTLRCRAHCLGPLAASVWRHCDGRATVAEIAAAVSGETHAEVDAGMVWVAARRLGKARLLREDVDLPSAPGRREWLKKAALLGGLTVLSITAPLSVEAATCTRNCVARANGTCTTLPCCPPATGNCCHQGGGRNCACRTMGGCTA